jgi:polysaccharide export outer membrane protein
MKIKVSFVILIVLLGLFSCTPQKNYIYLQDKGNNSGTSTVKANTFEYKIKPKDVLYIKTVPIDEPSITSLNSSVQSNAMSSDLSAYLNSFDVSDSGFVNLPLIGSILVNDLTIAGCQKIIQEKVNLYLKNTLVVVKLLNFNVTVLGEVNKPGTYRVYNNQVTILEALGLAGDLTINGNRKQIMLVRQNNNGNIINIDLTDKKLLYSDYFYLQPNDVLYIKPTRSKIYGTNPFPFATALSAVTTFFLVLNYLKK